MSRRDVRGLRLGIAGVLFSGLLFGHFGATIAPPVHEFARDFGLILFVYAIGIEVGPGFTRSFCRHGLPLNLIAAGTVILGAATAVVISRAAGIGIPVAVGMFSGATTNTPSLGAAHRAAVHAVRRRGSLQGALFMAGCSPSAGGTSVLPAISSGVTAGALTPAERHPEQADHEHQDSELPEDK